MATTLATMAEEWRVGLFYSLLGAFTALLVGYQPIQKAGKAQGLQEGLTTYHQVCYDVGGIVEHNNTFVLCSGMKNYLTRQ